MLLLNYCTLCYLFEEACYIYYLRNSSHWQANNIEQTVNKNTETNRIVP